MIVIPVILALLIMGCKSYEKNTKIFTRQAPNSVLPCSEKLGYLSFPKDSDDGQDCHLPYRQGPCKPAEMLVSANNGNTGKCVRNFCEKDGVVLFEFECYDLNSEGPCKPSNGQTYKFGVNPSTFTLQCLPDF